jgi:hypothetical protein
MVLLCTLFLTACEKESASPAYNEDPVIEGYLFANNIASIRITSQIAVSTETSGAGEGIDTLQVYIDSEDGTHQLVNIGNGVYQDSGLVIAEGKQYKLHFAYRGKTVSATTTIPSLPRNFTQSDTDIYLTKIDSTFTFTPGAGGGGGFQMNDPIELDWENSDNSYFMIVVENIESELELIRDTTNTRFRVTNFRNEPSVTKELEIRDQQFQYFGTHTITLYHLNPDYAALYSGNSNSSQNLTNPTTNITNGVGIFTGIGTDTLLFEVKKE